MVLSSLEKKGPVGQNILSFHISHLPRLSKTKNLGRLWLAYTELQGEFYMLQLIYVDSRHFTSSYPYPPKDVGLLWYHQMLERIMGNYQ